MLEGSRDHAYGLPAVVVYAVADASHEASASASPYESVAVAGHPLSKLACRCVVFFGDIVIRRAVDSYFHRL